MDIKYVDNKFEYLKPGDIVKLSNDKNDEIDIVYVRYVLYESGNKPSYRIYGRLVSLNPEYNTIKIGDYYINNTIFNPREKSEIDDCNYNIDEILVNVGEYYGHEYIDILEHILDTHPGALAINLDKLSNDQRNEIVKNISSIYTMKCLIDTLNKSIDNLLCDIDDELENIKK